MVQLSVACWLLTITARRDSAPIHLCEGSFAICVTHIWAANVSQQRDTYVGRKCVTILCPGIALKLGPETLTFQHADISVT